MSKLKNTIEYLNKVAEDLKKLEEERDEGEIKFGEKTEEFVLHQKRKIEIADIITKWSKEDDKTDVMDLEDYLEILKEVYNDHDKEINIHLEEEREKLNNTEEYAEERGIIKTMRYLKQNCEELYFKKFDGYHIDEDNLEENDVYLIENIKQM